MTENEERLTDEVNVLKRNGYNVDFTSVYMSHDGYNEWVDPTTTWLMFSRIVKCIDIKPNWGFLDCGSGLGYVLYLASGFFSKVTGVEILCDVYRKSISNLDILLPDNNIDVYNCDMFDLPYSVWDEANVFYVSSPFQEYDLIEKLANQVIESLNRVEREIYIVYYYPYCADVFDRYAEILELEYEVYGLGVAKIYHHF